MIPQPERMKFFMTSGSCWAVHRFSSDRNCPSQDEAWEVLAPRAFLGRSLQMARW